MPSMIYYIQTETDGQKVAVVGYSLSSTFLFSAFAKYPEWFEERVSIGVALGPCVKMTNTKSDAFRVSADYYSLSPDSYFYDIVTGGDYYCK